MKNHLLRFNARAVRRRVHRAADEIACMEGDALNRAEQELSRITAETPPFVVAALRERELTFRNSKTLHEAYFANLGGNGRRTGVIEAALEQAYGTTARWEEHIRAGAPRAFSCGNHKEVLATSVPLLVMDMYEHSYQMDFGAGVARYIDAFFGNVKWDEVNRRLERDHRASAVFRGTTG